MSTQKINGVSLFLCISIGLLLLLPMLVSAGCTCDYNRKKPGDKNKTASLDLKIVGFFVILVSSVLGVVIPFLGKWVAWIQPDKNGFLYIKAFSAGVILSTAFTHIFPSSFKALTSPCLNAVPWGKFPFAGFITMVAAMLTLLVDCMASGYIKKKHSGRSQNDGNNGGDEEKSGNDEGEVESISADTLRNRIISQVLEFGIVVHSVIIGITLGTSQNRTAIESLIIALCFHQFFEGMGLGSSINLGKFKNRAVIVMMLFFALTTPAGVAIGIGITTSYDKQSASSLIIEGVFNAAASGIMIYSSIVNLLVEDFMSDRMHKSGMLQLWSYCSLFLGAGAMSFVGKWN